MKMFISLDNYFSFSKIFDDMEGETDVEYYGGIFILEKNGIPIYSNYFIFDDITDQYMADAKLWKMLRKTFNEKRFSDFGEVIGDIDDPKLKLYIEDAALFNNGETFMDVKSLLEEQLDLVRENFNEDNIQVFQSMKDPYDVSELKKVLEDIIFDSVVEHGNSYFDFSHELYGDRYV